MKQNDYRIQKISKQRAIVVDSGYLGARRHLSHALIEIDVTRPRKIIQSWYVHSGEKLSFTTYLAACLGAGLHRYPEVHAYRDWRNRRILFEDVDIVTMIEARADQVAIPHILRSVQRRQVDDLTAEIRQVQTRPASSAQTNGIARLGLYAPRPVRMMYYWGLRQNPFWMKEIAGTAALTSVGMFGQGGGWGISFVPLHTFGMLVGGISERLVLENGKILAHEVLNVTLSFDHDMIDGAPAARFTEYLRTQIEEAACLDAFSAPGLE